MDFNASWEIEFLENSREIMLSSARKSYSKGKLHVHVSYNSITISTNRMNIAPL